MTTIPAESTTPPRRRMESSKTTTQVSGWDHPPAVASPSSLEYGNDGRWIPRPCHWRTPQHLFVLDPSKTDRKTQEEHQPPKDFEWGNLLCSPILVANKYILVASDNSLLIYGNFDTKPKDTQSMSPLTKFFLDATDEGGSFGHDRILQIEFHEETSIVYALTVESCVYQVKLVLDEHGATPTFQMMHSWITRELGVTCMATWNNSDGFDTISVGYRSGHLEAWKVPQVHTVDPKRTSRMRGPRKTSRNVKLEWDGFLYDSIQTLSFLPHSNGPHENNQDDLYLMAAVSIVTKADDKGAEQPTSSMLKILDLQQIVDEKKKRMEEPSSVSTEEDKTIALEHFSITQSRGMELLAASTVSLSKDCNLPKRSPVLDNTRANAACNLSVDGKNYSSLAFSDGVVGLFSRNGDTVGISETNHQVLFSYPAIGSGHIRIADEKKNTCDCLAVCLRGGTCYLIPVESKSNDNSVGVIPFPHDLEMDLSDVFVQSFCAGNLKIDGTDLAVVVYAWPGGVMDIYSIELVNSMASKESEINKVFVSRTEKRCLRDLIDNDAITIVSQILKDSRDNPLLQTGDWKELLDDTKAGKISLPAPEEEIGLESLCSKEFESLRRVLLSLALITEQ